MLAVKGYFDGNAYIADEAVAVRPNQRVIITILDENQQNMPQSKAEAIAELKSLCHPGKHVWTENPAAYIRRMRDEERF